MNKAKTTLFYMCVKAGSQLGLPGSIGFRRVNSTSGFYLDPDRFHARDGQVLDRPAGPVRVSKLWLLDCDDLETIEEMLFLI
jgi:hypothetical protein